MSLLMDALKKAELSKTGAEVFAISDRTVSELKSPDLPEAEAPVEEIVPEIEVPAEPEQSATAVVAADKPVVSAAVEEELSLELDAVGALDEPEQQLQRTPEPAAPSESTVQQKPRIAPQPLTEPRSYQPVVKARLSSRYLFGLLLAVVVVVLIGSYYYLENQLNNRQDDLLIAPPAMDVAGMIDYPAGGASARQQPAVESVQSAAVDQKAGNPVKSEPVLIKTKQPVMHQKPAIAPPVKSKAAPNAKPMPSKPAPEVTTAKQPVRISRSQQKSRLQQQLESAYGAYQTGDLKVAKQGYQQVLKRAPNSRDALMGLAAVHQQQGDLQQARRYYQQLLRLNPKDSVAVSGLISLQGRGAVQNESRIKLLLDQEPNAAYLHFALGSQYVSQSRWAEAQQAFFQAFHNDPQNPDYIFNLAVSLDHLGKRKMALVYYLRALEQVPGRRVGFDLGRLKQRIGQLQ